MKACEQEGVERAANEYYQRFNEDQFQKIFDEGTEGSKNLFTETNFVPQLEAAKKKYGSVGNKSLIGVNVEPDEGDCEATAVNAQYEVYAEKGKYVEWIRWHIVDGETRMARRTFLEFDKNGKLYLTLNLRTGLDEKDIIETKIQVQK